MYEISGILVVAILVIVFILDTFFGPSPTTLEAQRRLYEEDIKKSRTDYEAAVEAEMERIRRARRISRNEVST